MAKNQNFEKLLNMCLDIDLKIIFIKHWIPMPKHYVHEVKNSIKSSKMVLKLSKMKIFKKYLFCSFYVIMSLHAENCVCWSDGMARGQYKDERTPKK